MNIGYDFGGQIIDLYACSDRKSWLFAQEFYCLAWTTLTLEHEGKELTSNILAASGEKCLIELIHPQQQSCYAVLGNKRPNVTCRAFMATALKFLEEQPEILLCRLTFYG